MDTGSIIGHIKFLDDQISAWEAHHEHLQALTQQPDTLELAEFCRSSASYIRRLKGDRSEALAALEKLESKHSGISPMDATTADEQAVMTLNATSPASI